MDAEQLFKPITESLRETAKETAKETIKAIEGKETLTSDSLADALKKYKFSDPIAQDIEDDIRDKVVTGEVAKGIRMRNNVPHLGVLPVKIDRENKTIYVGEKGYPLSEGILHLLMTKDVTKNYTEDEKNNYVDMLFRGGLLHKKDGTPQGWKGPKYRDIIKGRAGNVISSYDTEQIRQIRENWGKIGSQTGSGMRQKRGSVIDVVVGSPEELLDQMQLALASIQAGNSSNLLKNKVIAIADYLLKINKIKKSTYIELQRHVS